MSDQRFGYNRRDEEEPVDSLEQWFDATHPYNLIPLSDRVEFLHGIATHVKAEEIIHLTKRVIESTSGHEGARDRSQIVLQILDPVEVLLLIENALILKVKSKSTGDLNNPYIYIPATDYYIPVFDRVSTPAELLLIVERGNGQLVDEPEES